MTHEEKLEYMRIAIAICGYGFPKSKIDLFVSLYEKILANQGEVDLKDVVKLELEIEAKYAPVTETPPVGQEPTETAC